MKVSIPSVITVITLSLFIIANYFIAAAYQYEIPYNQKINFAELFRLIPSIRSNNFKVVTDSLILFFPVLLFFLIYKLPNSKNVLKFWLLVLLLVLSFLPAAMGLFSLFFGVVDGFDGEWLHEHWPLIEVFGIWYLMALSFVIFWKLQLNKGS